MSETPALDSFTVDLPAVPLAWRLRSHLPTLGHLLPTTGLTWPRDVRTLVAVEREEVADAAWPAAAPELCFAEVSSEDALAALVSAARRDDVALLAFAGPAIGVEAIRAARGTSADIVALAMDPADLPGLAQRAARVTERLVRARASRALLRHWRAAAILRRDAAMALHPTAVLAPRPLAPLAPLSTVVGLHVARLFGLWWPTESTLHDRLGVSRSVLERLRARLLPGLAAATNHPSQKPREVLIVEDLPELAAAMARHFRLELSRAGTEGHVSLAVSVSQAQALVETRGAPDIAWVDMHLEAPHDGLAFVRWLRARGGSTVILGKTALAGPDDVRDLMALGALAVWTGEFDRPTEGALPGTPTSGVQSLIAEARRAVALVAQRHAWERAEEVVRTLGREAWAGEAAGVGEHDCTIAALEERTIRHAIDTAGSEPEGAAALEIEHPRRAGLLSAL